MIEIHFNGRYKSITPFRCSFPKFAVLTGVNGAGKTQILKGIKEGIFKSSGFNQENITLYSPYETPFVLSGNSLPDFRHSLISEILITIKPYQKAFGLEELEQDFADFKYLSLVKDIIKTSGKTLPELNFDTINSFLPIYEELYPSEIFLYDLEKLFLTYRELQRHNYNREFRAYKNLPESNFLTDAEFLTIHGPEPWTLLNSFINEIDLPFNIVTPSFDFDVPYKIRFFDKHSREEIDFSDISNGEKIIFFLTLAILKQALKFKKIGLLLMDEPDASLHPLMVKNFINMLYRISEKQELYILFTTHSPTTIALVAEEAIFVVNKNYSKNKVEKISKDHALSLLTAGIPSLSIHYENRRQIFVESNYDVEYYSNFHTILKSKLNSEVSLNFISSGEAIKNSKGTATASCDQVKKVTKLLRDKGNLQVWGLIDRDENNKTEEFINVLGNGNRYSIENYIFDPLLLGLLLFRENIIKKDQIKLEEHEGYADFKNFSQDRLQSIVDFVTTKLQSKVAEKIDSNVNYGLINGISLTIPVWYVEYQGHRLEDAALAAFPKLHAVKRNQENFLKNRLIETVAADFPEFIPKDILDSFVALQQM